MTRADGDHLIQVMLGQRGRVMVEARTTVRDLLSSVDT
jgi:hypothetical protein